jgi:hypothetical protein
MKIALPYFPSQCSAYLMGSQKHHLTCGLSCKQVFYEHYCHESTPHKCDERASDDGLDIPSQFFSLILQGTDE